MKLYVNLLVPILGLGTVSILCLESKELFWVTEQKLNSPYLLRNSLVLTSLILQQPYIKYCILHLYFSHI